MTRANRSILAPTRFGSNPRIRRGLTRSLQSSSIERNCVGSRLWPALHCPIGFDERPVEGRSRRPFLNAWLDMHEPGGAVAQALGVGREARAHRAFLAGVGRVVP